MGVLIKIAGDKKVAMKLLDLKGLVDRYVFEQEKMTNAECDIMYSQLGQWATAIKERRETGKVLNVEGTEEEMMVGFLCLKVQQKDEGKFDSMLKLFKDTGVNWRKFLRYPSAYNPGDFARARRLYAEYARKHPEQEGLVATRKARMII